MHKWLASIVVISLSLFTVGCNKKTQPNKDSMVPVFVGYWKTFASNESGGGQRQLYVSVLEGHTAKSSIGADRDGTWEIVAERLEIKWKDGWKDFILKTNSGFKKMSYAPNRPLDWTATSSAPAYKVDGPIKTEEIESTERESNAIRTLE